VVGDVGFAVGAFVGSNVGFGVGLSVGVRVGLTVGSCVAARTQEVGIRYQSVVIQTLESSRSICFTMNNSRLCAGRLACLFFQ